MRRITTLCLLAVGCANAFDIDGTEFARLANIRDLDYANVEPAQVHQYWELRYAFEQAPPTVVGSGGTSRRDQLDPAIRAALDTVRPPSGFATGCLPGFCYYYLVAANGSIRTITTPPQLADFLGTVGSLEEAALLAHARGLHWDAQNAATGYRQVTNGWQILGLQLVRDCAPVQTDRVLLLIRDDGRVVELGREVYERSENACI